MTRLVTGDVVRLLASACFVLGFLYAAIAVYRLEPVWSVDHHLIRATTAAYRSVSRNGNHDNNNADDISSDCWKRPIPVWARSFVITQNRVPDIDSKVGPSKTVTYYDYDLGGNLIQDFRENGDVLWDLELSNHHSFYFYPSKQTCKPVDMPVGILRPDWLAGATPLGPSVSTWRRSHTYADDHDATDRLVCGWTKADFIDYYVDAATGVPDSWYFHNMKANFYVLNYTETEPIDPALFVPPDYCF